MKGLAFPLEAGRLEISLCPANSALYEPSRSSVAWHYQRYSPRLHPLRLHVVLTSRMFATIEMLIFSVERKGQRKTLSWGQITFFLQLFYVPLKTMLCRNRFKPYFFFPTYFSWSCVISEHFHRDSYHQIWLPSVMLRSILCHKSFRFFQNLFGGRKLLFPILKCSL